MIEDRIEDYEEVGEFHCSMIFCETCCKEDCPIQGKEGNK